MQTSGWPLRRFFSPKLLLLISIELHGIDHVVWLINPSRTIDSSWEQHVQPAATMRHTLLSVCSNQPSLKGNTAFICVCALCLTITYFPADCAPSGNWCTPQRFSLTALYWCHVNLLFSPCALCFFTPQVLTFDVYVCVCYCLVAVSLLSSHQKAANAHFSVGSPACQRRWGRVTAALNRAFGEQLFTQAIWMGENTVAMQKEAVGAVTEPD